MGSVDIKEAAEILRGTAAYIRRIWPNRKSVDYLMLIVVILYQYLEANTAIIVQNEYDKQYYINKSKIAANTSIKYALIADLICTTREYVCHHFGSQRCSDSLKRLSKHMSELEDFVKSLGIIKED